MTNFKKFATIGLVALAVSLQACTVYTPRSLDMEVSTQQDEIVFVVGQTRELNAYNIVKPINVIFKAMENHSLNIQGKDVKDYTIKINPQDEINLKFDMKKDGSDDLVSFDTHIKTYKEPQMHHQRTNIVEKNFVKTKYGNSFEVVGHNYTYNVDSNTKEMTFDMNEHNELNKQNIYLVNAKQEMQIKLISPKYTSFVFENGQISKVCVFTLKAGGNTQMLMKLRSDNLNKVESKTYSFRQV